MPYETDERLKGYLDTNQLAREQVCLAILALDKRFSEVQPRHPRGGPDGGRDIDAMFHGTQRAFGAVGFVNQADDSAKKKRRARDKFRADLTAALGAIPKPQVFIFLTNVNFTAREKDALVADALGAGFSYCEVFDRERLRIALDGTDGLAARYQHLGIPLSEAEQAAFFAQWGDDIQSVIATGFQGVHRTLNRLLFLQESTNPLSGLSVLFELDQAYPAEAIGHFRAFCMLYLKEPKHGIFSVLFGASDKSDRMLSDIPVSQKQKTPPGIAAGIGGGQWEERFDPTSESGSGDEDESRQDDADEELMPEYIAVGSSSSIGMPEVKSIGIQYHKDSLVRLAPVMTLRDLDESSFLARLNRGLAEKVSCIHVYANEYKVLEIPKGEFALDDSLRPSHIPVDFSDAELRDPWVYICPEGATMFMLRFSEQTPRRFYSPRETEDNLRRPSRI